MRLTVSNFNGKCVRSRAGYSSDTYNVTSTLSASPPGRAAKDNSVTIINMSEKLYSNFLLLFKTYDLYITGFIEHESY